MPDLQALDVLLPMQEGQDFIRFPPSAAGARRWLEGLPRANLGGTTRALYEALTELNRCQLAPRQRMAVLDVLRPEVESVRTGLARHYLNQPTVLPEQPAQVAYLVETLHREMAENYARVAREAALEGQSKMLARSIGYAIRALNLNLLLASQLYRPPAEGSWRLLHTLYRGLWQSELEHERIKAGGDWLHPGNEYRCALLMGTAGTNQLRQRELETLFALLEQWAPKVVLSSPANAASPWVIDPDGDDGPILSGHADAGAIWGLDTRPVAEHLLNATGLDLSPNLSHHLQAAWSANTSRGFARLQSCDRLEVILGLAATHYFVSAGEDFQQLTSGRPQPWSDYEDNPFMRGKTVPGAQPGKQRPKDVWDEAYGSAEDREALSIETIDYNIQRHHKQQGQGRSRYHTQQVETVNTSPGGYCLQWPPHTHLPLRAGELLGLRTRDQEGWSIAMIRWVQLQAQGPQAGVQLLSPTAVPYGARSLVNSIPQGEYQRVLVLPEVRALGQPTTLITPNLPFREGQKVELAQHGQQSRVQLTVQVAATGLFSQYEFRRLSAPKLESSADEGDFDALWEQL